MRKIFLFVIFFGLFFTVNAQSTISISGGIKKTIGDVRSMTLTYVDDSPFKNELYKEIKPAGRNNFTLSLRSEKNGEKLNPFAEGQFYFGNLTGLALGLGCSYNIPSERRTKIKPELSAVFGISSKDLGTIESKDDYVKVNSIRFMDYSNPDVALQTFCFGIKPGVSFVVDAGHDNEFGVRINYQLSFKLGYLAFSGLNNNGDETSAIETLNSRNVILNVDGKRSNKAPFNPDGIEISLFYSF